MKTDEECDSRKGEVKVIRYVCQLVGRCDGHGGDVGRCDSCQKV